MSFTRRQAWGALAGVSLVAVVVRSYYFPRVFRGDDVVHIRVDPWMYQVAIEQLTARTDGPLDLGLFIDPGRDDLMLSTLGWAAEVLGGDPHTVGVVLAVYPVVAAVAMCGCVYLGGAWLTNDRLVGVVGAIIVALTPAHVYRTTLGFGDHHAFDYLILGLTIATVLFLVGKRGRDRNRWLATGVLGGALAAQLLAWRAGVLLIVPYTAFCALLGFSTLRTTERPMETCAPFVGALAIATGLTGVAVVTVGWQSPPTVSAVAVQTGVVGALVGTYELAHRREWSLGRSGGVVTAEVGLGLLLFRDRTSAVTEFVETGVSYFTQTTGTVEEATSLFVSESPAMTLLSFFGFFVLAFVPYLLLLTRRAIVTHHPGWLAVVTYTWAFIGLAGIQRRFSGELSLFFAIIVGFAAVDGWRRLRAVLRDHRWTEQGGVNDTGRDQQLRTVDLSVLLVAVLVGVFVVSATVAQVPLTMNSQTVSDGQFSAANRIETHAAAQNWNESSGYVFSSVDTNPMYNYYSHGESVSIWRAQTEYFSFVIGTDGEAWYRTLRRQGTGFVVVSDRVQVDRADSLHTVLHRNLGSARGDVDGVGNYRLLYRSEDESTTVYTLVPGALVSGGAPSNASVSVVTTARTSDGTIRYERRPEVTADGRYGVLVPYPGTYKLNSTTVTVSERDVREGRTVGRQPSKAHWAFDEGEGSLLFDRVGNNHATGRGLDWTTGVEQTALSLKGDSYAAVRGERRLQTADGFTLSLWVKTRDTTEGRGAKRYPRIASAALGGTYQNTDGYQIAMADGRVVGAVGNGTTASVLAGPRIDDNRWHHVTLAWNGSVTSLSVDGERWATGRFKGRPGQAAPLTFGASSEGEYKFVGEIDEVRFVDRAEMSTVNRTDPRNT